MDKSVYQEPAPLLEVDWNFAPVPKSELIACCCWEYARESAFLRQVCARYRDVPIEFRTGFGDPSEIPRGRFGAVFTAGWPLNEHGLAWSFEGGFPTPWQQLGQAERAYRTGLADTRPLHPAIRREAFWTLDELGRQAADHMKRAQQLGQQQVAASTYNPSVIWPSGRESALIRFAWADYTDDELAGHFRAWVKANRPKEIPPPDRRGNRLTNWRVALTRLGIMRALHVHSFADHRFPVPLKSRGDKECYRARDAAVAMYHQLFPFLPKQEKPLSWQTKAGRSRG